MSARLTAALEKKQKDVFSKDILLSNHCSYKIGGKARYFLEVSDLDDLQKAVNEAKRENLRIFILGGGTNLLIDDNGFDGLVLKPNFLKIEKGPDFINAGAGILMADLLDFMVKNSLSGLEWAGGLPGTLGGAIRGNAGAFGGEIKDSVTEVESLDISAPEPRIVIKRERDSCNFGYRTSIFKERGGSEVILGAVLKLKEGDKKDIEKKIKEKIDYRKERHPMEYPNIGSIFKNVDARNFSLEKLAPFKSVLKHDPFLVIPTAFLISEAGLKGVSSGGASISQKHPNFIINSGNASSRDVKNLIAFIKKTIREKFDISLEEEVQYL